MCVTEVTCVNTKVQTWTSA